MSARTLRKTFANPFVVTLAALPTAAACMVQSAPPARGGSQGPTRTAPINETGQQPPPANVEQAPPPNQPPPTVIANPPPPQQPTQVAQFESHWTVMKSGDKCQAYVNVTCPKNATCNPPPPRAYACTADITEKTPLKIVQYQGSDYCQVETAPFKCPPNASCNPPRPQRVPCPQ